MSWLVTPPLPSLPPSLYLRMKPHPLPGASRLSPSLWPSSSSPPIIKWSLQFPWKPERPNSQASHQNTVCATFWVGGNGVKVGKWPIKPVPILLTVLFAWKEDLHFLICTSKESRWVEAKASLAALRGHRDPPSYTPMSRTFPTDTPTQSHSTAVPRTHGCMTQKLTQAHEVTQQCTHIRIHMSVHTHTNAWSMQSYTCSQTHSQFHTNAYILIHVKNTLTYSCMKHGSYDYTHAHTYMLRSHKCMYILTYQYFHKCTHSSMNTPGYICSRTCLYLHTHTAIIHTYIHVHKQTWIHDTSSPTCSPT